MSRPTVSETMLDVAEVISRRGTCTRLQVGAVIASPRGVILSTGYNGALPGAPHCDHRDHNEPGVGCVISSHAERNAIAWAARRGVSVEYEHLYTTHSPCDECAKMIVQAGIKRVIYRHAYRSTGGVCILEDSGVEVVAASPLQPDLAIPSGQRLLRGESGD